MGRFKDGNPPGNGKSDHANGKGNFNTTIYGDHILGTDGNDTGASSEVNNSIMSEALGLPAGHNLIDLLDGDDLFNGFGGDDKVYGNLGNDNLNGHEGDDFLAGGAGDDNISGGDGDDDLYGGDDDDTIEGGAGADYIDGGEGNDTASYEDSDAGVNVDLNLGDGGQVEDVSGGDADGDTLISIENLIGSDFNDFLEGNDQDNVIEGGDGDDMIWGRQGNDTLHGGDGEDLIRGNNGDDTIYGDAGADDLRGGTGEDTLDGGVGGDADVFRLGGGDGSRDTVVAQATQADNGSDSVLQYEDGVGGDVFDFSALLSGEDPANFDTFIYVTGNSIKGTNGTGDEITDTGDDTTWFTVWEDGGTDAADAIYIEVDGTDYTWDTGTGEWMLA